MAASYLTGGALGWFKAYHDEITQEIKFKTYAEFIRALKAAYDDPDKKATAERKLLALRHLNKDCSTYRAEFSIYANILEYDDCTKISFLKKGANNCNGSLRECGGLVWCTALGSVLGSYI